MIVNDFSRPYRCCFCKWDLMFEPRCLYLTLLISFQMPGHAINHIANTINQPHFHLYGMKPKSFQVGRLTGAITT